VEKRERGKGKNAPPLLFIFFTLLIGIIISIVHPVQITISTMLDASINACGGCCRGVEFKKKATHEHKPCIPATFIRVHDLDLTDEDRSRCSPGDESRSDVGTGRVGFFSSSSSSSSRVVGRGVDILSIEGDGSGAIMSALAVVGIREATDESSRWSPTGATDRILRKRPKGVGTNKVTTACGGPMGPWANAASGRDVLVWSSKCARGGHGSDNPIVKSRGLIPASAKAVVDLVRDSDRVREYNKLAIGREDQMALTTTADGGESSVHCAVTRCPRLGIAGEAKVMSSRSQPPLTLKPLEFKTLYYVRRLVGRDDGVDVDGDAAAYVTVGRSTWETPDGTAGGFDDSVTRCEILLVVNLLRDVRTEDGSEWCELTLITHAVSPVPIFVAKQVGLVAAENYIKDIRALFESK